MRQPPKQERFYRWRPLKSFHPHLFLFFFNSFAFGSGSTMIPGPYRGWTGRTVSAASRKGKQDGWCDQAIRIMRVT